MKRYLLWYTCTAEYDQDFYAPDADAALELARQWLEKTYPGDPGIDVMEIQDITHPNDEHMKADTTETIGLYPATTQD